MILLQVQWEKHAGPDSIGQHKLIFSMDESINHGEFNPMSLKKGTQFMLMMIPTNSTEYNEFANETIEKTKERFSKHMHSLIGEIAKEKKIKPEEYKDMIRTSLIKAGRIKKSTTELDIAGLSETIIHLRKVLKEYESN